MGLLARRSFTPSSFSSLNADTLRRVLEAVAAGTLSPDAAAGSFGEPELADGDLGFAVVDHDRGRRTGVPEVIYGPGKTAVQLRVLLEVIAARGQLALATRVDEEKAAAVIASGLNAVWEPVPRLFSLAPPGWVAHSLPGQICVCTGGTSDRPVAEEAARVLEWLGHRVDRVFDVGVAGVHRLLSRMERIRAADIVIVVAGMEGALPSVVAGLVSAPVIAVPTSIGYGTALAGFTPLFAMLTSCAAGVVVVNIDNGFGAAQAAHRMLAVKT